MFRKKLEDFSEEDLTIYLQNNTFTINESDFQIDSYVYDVFTKINLYSYLFFTIELLTKYVVCPAKCDFFKKSPLNIADALTIIAFYIFLVLNMYLIKGRDIFIALRIIESFRIVILFQ